VKGQTAQVQRATSYKCHSAQPTFSRLVNATGVVYTVAQKLTPLFIVNLVKTPKLVCMIYIN